MDNTINNIAAKISEQGNKVSNELITETELTDKLYELNMEEN